MTDTHKKFSQDEELSDFTDRVLKGQMKNNASESNEELRELEKTILRLHNNMPSSSLEESTRKQMLVRLNARIRREREQPQTKSFWASLFNFDGSQNKSRSQFSLVIGVIVLLVVAVILSPALSGSSTTATALSGSNGFILPVVLLGLIIVILWIKRKK